MIGKTINNYLIERKLGDGGMGVVYYARHNKVDREVAIKVLHSHLFQNEIIHNRFKNEANALIKLVHPNIVKIYDYVELENFACLIMEYVNGYTLDIYLNEYSGPLPSAKAVSIMSSVLDAVQYAHNCSIYHRDIKPSNIMISKDGNRVLIMDFGIAKLTDSNSFQTTHANTQLGTPFYMSPEQIKGLPYTQMSDIYSLGVTLFEMVTGKCPYQDVKSLFELQSKIVNEPLPLTSNFYPSVSPRIQSAIAKATQKLPQHRFQSCNEFKQFIQDFSSTTIVSAPNLKPVKVQKKNKSRNIIIGAVVVVLLAAVALIINSTPGSNNPTKPSDNKKLQLESYDIPVTRTDTVPTIVGQNLKTLNDYIERKLANSQSTLPENKKEEAVSKIMLTARVLTEDEIKEIVDTLFYTPPRVILPTDYQVRKDFKQSVENLSILCRLILSDFERQIKVLTIDKNNPNLSDPQPEIKIRVNFCIWDSEDSSDSTICYKDLIYIRSGDRYQFLKLRE